MRRRQWLQAASAAAIATVASRARAQDAPKRLAIVGGKLLEPQGEPIDDAVLLFEDGKISFVGSGREPQPGSEVIDAKGKIVTAGFVDVLTNIGNQEVSLEESTRDDHDDPDETDPIRAAFATADGYNPASTLVAVTRREGLTSVGVIPVQGLVSGQSAWVDLAGDTPAAALVEKSLALHVDLDDASYGSFGKSRGTVMLRLRELFDDTASFQKNPANYERSLLRAAGVSRLDLQVVARALTGELTVVFHVDRASDILNVLELSATHKLRTVLASVAEGWKVAAQIAAAKVPAVVYPLDHGPRSFAALGAREDNAALMQRAGVKLALSTGDSHNARKLRQVAGNAIRAGLPPQAALAAVTESPASMFGMRAYGVLEAGRVANAVVWSGDPFELSSHAEAVVIRGRRMSLETRQTALLERYR